MIENLIDDTTGYSADNTLGSAQDSATDRTFETSVRAKKADTTHTTRTRCPNCKRLFAIETETLDAMSRAGVLRAEFNCTSLTCGQAFGLKLPLLSSDRALPILMAVPLIRSTLIAEPEIDVSVPEKIEEENQDRTSDRSPGESAPLESSRSAAVRERDCPRCGATNPMSSTDCVRCGIVFQRVVGKPDLRVEEEIALGGTRELSGLWDLVIEDYEDRIRHERFLNACKDAHALSYAMKKYAQILVSAPQDEVARMMRNRIVALVSVTAESSKLPIRLNFRIPKLNSLALFMGSILFFWGLAMPQLKNIMEIGLSMVLLTIGVRLALRTRV